MGLVVFGVYLRHHQCRALLDSITLESLDARVVDGFACAVKRTSSVIADDNAECTLPARMACLGTWLVGLRPLWCGLYRLHDLCGGGLA
jgi:hypothetical protein